MLNALNAIRGSVLSCEHAMPPDPPGKKLDPYAVTLQYTPTGGTPTALPHDATCAGPGWHYDDLANPTKVILCPATCSTIMADAKGQVELLVGCEEVITPPKYAAVRATPERSFATRFAPPITPLPRSRTGVGSSLWRANLAGPEQEPTIMEGR